jgi:hypothetical protein
MLSKSRLRSADFLIGVFVVCPGLVLAGFLIAVNHRGLWMLVVEGRVPDPHAVPPDTMLVADGVRLPPTLAADAATVEDDAPVVGIEASGMHRAYLLEGMTTKKRHVANDLVAGVPISITYCDLTGCVAAYTDPGAHEPLDLAIAGFVDQKLALHSGGYAYFQEGARVPGSAAPTEQIPFAHYPIVQTTWKKWREEHPDTDIYIGAGRKRFGSFD